VFVGKGGVPVRKGNWPSGVLVKKSSVPVRKRDMRNQPPDRELRLADGLQTLQNEEEKQSEHTGGQRQ
jgi:hypothetical protein